MPPKESADSKKIAQLEEALIEQSQKIQAYHSQLAGANERLENAQEQIASLSAQVNDWTNAFDAIATLSSPPTSKDQE